ncbi:hypothetical protein SERLADRAFT_378014, partial [Serpula lacrymans var. lacrymans S7.9]
MSACRHSDWLSWDHVVTRASPPQKSDHIRSSYSRKSRQRRLGSYVDSRTLSCTAHIQPDCVACLVIKL